MCELMCTVKVYFSDRHICVVPKHFLRFPYTRLYHDFSIFSLFGCATNRRFASRRAVMVTNIFATKRNERQQDAKDRRFSGIEGRIFSYDHKRRKPRGRNIRQYSSFPVTCTRPTNAEMRGTQEKPLLGLK